MGYYGKYYGVTEKNIHGIMVDKISFDRAIRVLYNNGLTETDASRWELGGEAQGNSMHGCVNSRGDFQVEKRSNERISQWCYDNISVFRTASCRSRGRNPVLATERAIWH